MIPSQELVAAGKNLERTVEEARIEFDRKKNDYDAKKLEYREFKKNNPEYELTTVIFDKELKKQEKKLEEKNKYLLAAVAVGTFGLICSFTYTIQKSTDLPTKKP